MFTEFLEAKEASRLFVAPSLKTADSKIHHPSRSFRSRLLPHPSEEVELSLSFPSRLTTR